MDVIDAEKNRMMKWAGNEEKMNLKRDNDCEVIIFDFDTWNPHSIDNSRSIDRHRVI